MRLTTYRFVFGSFKCIFYILTRKVSIKCELLRYFFSLDLCRYSPEELHAMVDLKPEKKEEDWVFVNEHALGLYHIDK